MEVRKKSIKSMQTSGLRACACGDDNPACVYTGIYKKVFQQQETLSFTILLGALHVREKRPWTLLLQEIVNRRNMRPFLLSLMVK